MLQQHTVQTCLPQASNMVKRIVLEPFKLGEFPMQSLTLQKDVKVRLPNTRPGGPPGQRMHSSRLLTKNAEEGNSAAAVPDVPDTPDAYDHYTPILTDVDRRPYINLTPAKEDWLRTPYGIDPTKESTLLDKDGKPEVLRLAVEADAACERLFSAMDRKIKKQLNKERAKTVENFYSMCHTSDAEKYPICFPIRLDLRTTQFKIVQDGKVVSGMGWDFIRDVNFRNALVKVIVLPARVWATGDKGGTNLLTTCLVVKPGAGSPEIVITDFPDEDLL